MKVIGIQTVAANGSRGLWVLLLLVSPWLASERLTGEETTTQQSRPNILIAISDDQSYPHASAYGCRFVNTPGFDEVARSGVLFRNAFAATPGCSPSRAALLTGLHAWQIEHAGTHASSFSNKFPVFPDLLESSGYLVGYTGKGWGPGNFRDGGRDRNPAGPAFQSSKLSESPGGISNNNYAGNFIEFLNGRDDEQPFCFWFGAHEPHRGFAKGRGRELGKDSEDVDVPSFLPDSELVRQDLLDYAGEIEWFDQHLMQMIEHLEEIGQRDNTIIIVTSDNGMAFPRAKANLYEYGIHVPLAISWPSEVAGDRVSEDVVSFVDLTATILEATGVTRPEGTLDGAGTSLVGLLKSDQSGYIESERTSIFASRERHSSSRFRSLGYPQRAIRTPQFLLIHNPRPERWPAGTPQKFGRGGYPRPEEVANETLGPEHGGYHDIDACPTLTWMIENREDPSVQPFFAWSVAKRPEFELFDIQKDPGCINDLSSNDEFGEVLALLKKELRDEQVRTDDPRSSGNGDIFESYPRYSNLRFFPEPQWAQDMPERVPERAWWQQRFEATVSRGKE